MRRRPRPARAPIRPVRTVPIRTGPIALLLSVVAAPLVAAAETPRRNGFLLEPSAIPVEEILRGGPERDGIPALDDPAVTPASAAPWSDDEMVIGLVVEGEARAYPLSILVWHELVNDRLGGLPVLVSYCPLCGTGIVFDRRVAGRTLRFGVSGLLYRSDLLMFDRESESLWSQISARAETGPRLGQRLSLVRSRMVSWGRWKQAHPDTTVLSRATGHVRRYGQSPYRGYESSERLHFPVPLDSRYHPKTPTLGLRLADGRARAYPADEVVAAGGEVSERFGGGAVRVHYDRQSRAFEVEAPEGVEVVEGFWFAWAAFHPQSQVFRASRDDATP
jgi:hypothetical protein